tara:strand:+ start:579 stop:821 length:243 start_codon:yes stop_codon:yes gene_type:complete
MELPTSGLLITKYKYAIPMAIIIVDEKIPFTTKPIVDFVKNLDNRDGITQAIAHIETTGRMISKVKLISLIINPDPILMA